MKITKKFSLPELLFYNEVIMVICECLIDVQFFDLDPMNIVWHGNYVKYLEHARCDMLSKIGYSYDDMRADGIAYPVAKMDLKFIKPAFFMQKLKIVTRLVEIEPSLIIKYEIFDATTGEKIFTAKSMQICVDINSMESIYTAPKKFIERLKNYA